MGTDYIEIHTSDRQLFKRCRRKFAWASTMRSNLTAVGPERSAFFFGTGFHFGLEDYWGYRRWSHPAEAFAAYYDAHDEDELPEDGDKLLELAFGMYDYYINDWLVEHPEPYKTLMVDEKPQVEVEVSIDITETVLEGAERLSREYRRMVEDWISGKKILYVTTYDRAVIDDDEVIYAVDYKTAASFDELNLLNNPQADSYDWSAYNMYAPLGYRVGGMVWQQHKKSFPVPPKRVYVGTKREAFSMDFSQATTHRLYRRAVKDHYGEVPAKYNEILSFLRDLRDDYGDPFVRREVLRRNSRQREVTQEKIVAEALEMLDPELPLYPNPTKDCSWDCPFKAPCLAMDDGSDYEFMLKANFSPWSGYRDPWRKRVKFPSTKKDQTTTLITA